jgi:hypothetical protein
MTRPSNREIEQYYFAQFRAHFPLPAGEVEHGDKPDVVIHGERQLGIQIANLYLTDGADPTSEQVQRKRREAIVSEAQKRHFLAGGKKIELTVAFDPLHPIADINSVASALATVAQSIQHLQVGALPRHHFEHIAHLQFIYHNPTEYPDARWRVSQVFTVPNLSVDRVAQIVAIKEQRLPVSAHDDMLDALARIAEPELQLRWPGKEEPLPKIPVWKPLDPEVGYVFIFAMALSLLSSFSDSGLLA